MFPLSVRGSGESLPEKHFYACFWLKFQVSNLIFIASLTYFMQYFASISAYTVTVAGIQSKKKGNDQELTKYLINDCSLFWSMRAGLWSTKYVVPCAGTPWAPKNGPEVACVSAETVQCLRSQNS